MKAFLITALIILGVVLFLSVCSKATLGAPSAAFEPVCWDGISVPLPGPRSIVCPGYTWLPTPEPTSVSILMPTPTMAPTATPEPTATVAPTATPTIIPTNTPEPTVTPTVEPEVYSFLQIKIMAFSNAARRDGVTCGAYQPNNWAAHQYPPGASMLQMNKRLAESAQSHAVHVASVDPGPNLSTSHHQTREALIEAGAFGENVGWAYGVATKFGVKHDLYEKFPERLARMLVDGWLSSPGHCHNLMNPRWNYIGTGESRNDETYNHYGVQVFAP